ncbi:MAG: MotA/TolQ/ExbB proton channel family protein [Candidatus Omnitrophica bacterium]|nr:MotA/TolQ/ExbB proton channel family protein [Candidatus Omnitrophota bacterium]
MVAIFQVGGIFTYGILGILAIALGLFCERVYFLYFQLKLNADDTLQRIALLLEKTNIRGALEECVKIEKHPLGRTLKAGLLRLNKKDKEIERAMEEKILREIPVIRARINYLAMLAIISILLGFLGTVVGLIGSLKEMVGQAPAADLLMSGISQAMFSIALGLMVSIPCLIGYFVLDNRGNYLIAQLKEKSLGLFNALSTLKGNT